MHTKTRKNLILSNLSFPTGAHLSPSRKIL